MKDKFGFGFMRLPQNQDKSINYNVLNEMIDAYMEAGFDYFDTAYGYMNKNSESAIRDCLVARYPRESFLLTNKLSTHYFRKEEEILPMFEEQLEKCGVEYFDYYFMHAQNREVYAKYKLVNAYEIARELKKQGKIKHLGISFHDSAEILEKILIEQEDIEVVQIQFNYLDYYNAGVQSKAVYDVCRKYDKEIMIMEPVKGGTLVNLPDDAKKVWDDLNQNCSYAGYALRFCASHEGVIKVLSGMNTMEQMLDNIKTMKEMIEFNEEEYEAASKVRNIIDSYNSIPCTACEYCVEVCPMKITIPYLFGCYNEKKIFNTYNSKVYYNIHTTEVGPSNCVGCRHCENVCPQGLNIISLLQEVKTEFEQ